MVIFLRKDIKYVARIAAVSQGRKQTYVIKRGFFYRVPIEN
ncbi:MAG TPA: hypothetical protein VGO68_05340 [Pyrinomonadaceae bacterium]|jgi:hypothetical protein|nr:hypothetical protein [Pyrinomonadaceae bacterium]